MVRKWSTVPIYLSYTTPQLGAQYDMMFNCRGGKDFLSFAEARELMRELGLKSYEVRQPLPLLLGAELDCVLISSV